MATFQAKILIADDEQLFLKTTAALLQQAGYECRTAADGSTALGLLEQESFDLLLSDLRMPGNFQLELLRHGRERWPYLPVIVVTGVPTLPSAIASIRMGIADYLLKPVKYDDLLTAVRRAMNRRLLPPSSASVERSYRGSSEEFPQIIGKSAAMRELFDLMSRIKHSDANVLITGESGTGKEIVARAIHDCSGRRTGNLQVVDCTAIPENLFESVLFGHAKGAFTGAASDQTGLIAMAHGGTAFFDEIGELSLALQAKLLRVIQEQTFTPLGKNSSQAIDTRFICATNRELQREVDIGTFRRDLFYRLAVVHLELPSLREREDDVLLLAEHFLQELRPPESHVTGFSDECIELMKSYRWPGNVRELRNAVERGIAMAQSSKIDVEDLPISLQSYKPGQGGDEQSPVANASRKTALNAADRNYFIRLLTRNAGNVAASAREANMSRQGLHKTLKRLGIDTQQYRG